MKKLFYFLLLLLGIGRTLHAQDLLTKRNGEEIAVIVMEVTPTEVKYRRFDNLNGPLFSVRREEVFMVKYINGTKQLFDQPVVPPTPVAAPATTPAASLPTPPPAAELGGVLVPGDEIDDMQTVSLDGPRVGCTVLLGGVVNRAREHISDLNPFLTQFGWQFEKRLFRMPNGRSGLVELVPLVGGLEQGRFIPSVSGLLGFRGAKGFEVGIGPNLTPLGSSVVLAVGTSFRSNGINFPVNLAVVPGNGGARVSLLVGFNARHR
jgi:hypothetical protein